MFNSSLIRKKLEKIEYTGKMSSEGGVGRGIVVAGSLRSSHGGDEEEDIESSSSSSSDDDDNDYGDRQQEEEEIELNFDGGDDEDEDEILETFGDAPPPLSSARKPKGKARATTQSSATAQLNSTATTIASGGGISSKQPSEVIDTDDAFGSRLHAAMAQSVNSVLGAKPSVTLTTAAQSSEFNNQEEVFGFTYKPFKKPSQNSKLSSPDDEFEKEQHRLFSPTATASKSNRTATKTNDKTNDNNDGGNDNNDDDDDDDEFDFSDDDDGGKKEEALKSLEAQLSQARSKARESDHVAEIDSATELQQQKQKQTISTSSSPSSKNIQEEESNYEKIDLKSASRKALSEITEVYSSGSGNIEVRLLDMDPDQMSTTKALPPLMTTSKELNVIEEGDEEEEEEEERIEIIKKNVELDNKIKIASEWDNLDNASAAETTFAPIRESATFDYSYNGVLSYLSSKDLSVHKSKIVTKDTSSKPSSFTSWFSSNEELKFDGCLSQLELPFLVAHVDYDPSNEIDVGILRHMYVLLYPESENSSFSLPPYGKHWDKIGFQGDNPGTDINRSMKMFAVLQTIHFIEHARNLATQAHRLSINSEIVSGLKMDNSWPYFCTSIGFTKEAIQALRRGDLNAKCNKRKDVLSVLHDFHHGCFLEFVTLLKGSPNVHHAVHLAKIREVSQKNPASILKNYKSFSASVDNSLASINTIIGKSVNSSSSKNSNSNSSNSNSSNSNSSSLTTKSTSSSSGGADDFKFDDLDKMNDDSSTSSGSSSGVSSLLTNVGIGKASKFIAKE